MGYNGDLYPTAGADVVMTTKGDMVDYNTARQRLGIGSANQILQVKSGLPSWETLSTAGSVLTTQEDVLYQSASGLARLGFGTSGDVLTTKGTGANPVWETPSGGGIWTANGYDINTSLGSELSVSISNTPDIVQVLFFVSGDTTSDNAQASFTVNDVTTSTYDEKIFGFYQSFDYDTSSSQSSARVDRTSNKDNRIGCIYIWKADSNLNGINGMSWHSDSYNTAQAGGTMNGGYRSISGGGNDTITGDITSVEFSMTNVDIVGSIQVNSMVYQ